eukprot:UN25257
MNKELLELLFRLIRKNLFRPLPTLEDLGLANSYQPDIVPIVEDWDNLQWVYEIFLVIIQTVDGRVLKGFLDMKFLQNLVENISSIDDREREEVKTALHKIYVKIVARRMQMRKCFGFFLINIVHTRVEHSRGIAPLLEICSSFISGFSVPIRQQHVVFFKSVLLPLHTHKKLPEFHIELMRCILLYLQKEDSLLGETMKALIQYWSCQNPEKQLYFLQEADDLFVMSLEKKEDVPKSNRPHCINFLKFVAKQVCVCPHIEIARRALHLWCTPGACIDSKENFSKSFLFCEEILTTLLPQIRTESIPLGIRCQRMT